MSAKASNSRPTLLFSSRRAATLTLPPSSTRHNRYQVVSYPVEAKYPAAWAWYKKMCAKPPTGSNEYLNGQVSAEEWGMGGGGHLSPLFCFRFLSPARIGLIVSSSHLSRPLTSLPPPPPPPQPPPIQFAFFGKVIWVLNMSRMFGGSHWIGNAKYH